MRVAVILVWRPKNYPDWQGHQSPGAKNIPAGLASDAMAAPYTAIHLASLLPRHWDIRIIHEMVQDVDANMDVDAVFLSTMDFCAPHARDLARKFRERGVSVIIGGLFPTLNPGYFDGVSDAVVVGEAEAIMPRLISDLERNRLQPMYIASGSPDLDALPIPRYDLVEPDFRVTLSYEATRGCPFTCSFCVLAATRVPYRRRPIPNVIRDIRNVPSSWSWLQRKYVMFWDNNLGVDRSYFRTLCEAMVPLKRIWATEVSIDTVTAESARWMAKAGCKFVYIGLESLSPESLRRSNKLHNRVTEYKRRLRYLHDNGVLVMSIFLGGLDGDTPEYLRELPDLISGIGVDLPVFSFVAPIDGTPFHEELRTAGRLLPGDLNWGLDGSHLVYRPDGISADELELMVFECMRRAYGPHRLAQRILRRVRSGFWTTLAVTAANLAYRPYQRSLSRVGRERVIRRGRWPGSPYE